MNDLKKAIKLIPMGLSFKSQMFTMGLFLVLGIVIEIFSKGSTYIGGFYVSICGLFIGQIILSLDISTLVQSSPYKKLFQVKVPLMTEFCMLMVVFTIEVIAHALMVHFGVSGYTPEENYAMQARSIFIIGIVISMTILLFGFCYKYFISSMVVFFLVMIPLIGFSQNTYLGISQYLGESFSRAIVVSYISIIISFVLSYGVMNLLYKKDISRLAFGAALRRAAK